MSRTRATPDEKAKRSKAIDRLLAETIGPIVPYFSGRALLEVFVVNEPQALIPHVKKIGEHTWLLTETVPGHDFNSAHSLVLWCGDLIAEVISGTATRESGIRLITWRLQDNTRAARVVKAAVKVWHE